MSNEGGRVPLRTGAPEETEACEVCGQDKRSLGARPAVVSFGITALYLCDRHEKVLESGIGELVNGLRQTCGLEGVIAVNLRYRAK